MAYNEGDIADGPNGQQLIFRGGRWVPVSSAPAGGPITIGTPDPTTEYRAPKAEAELTRLRQQIAQAPEAAALDNDIKRVNLENMRNPKSAPPSGYRYKADGSLEAIPGGPIVAANGVKKGNGSLDAIVSQINDYSKRYGATAGATSGIGGIADYLPSQDKSALDASGDLLEEIATSAFKVPGMGGQSDADAARLARAYKPSRYSLDSGTRATLDGLRRRVDFARDASGLPAAVWEADAAKTLAAGATKSVTDPSKAAGVAALQTLLRSGAPDDQIRAAASALNASD
ncbi:MAG: hypothetical protein EOO80_11080, partial [Oxalobacteraceae bacterium]